MVFTGNFQHLYSFCNAYNHLLELYEIIHNIDASVPDKYFREAIMGYYIKITCNIDVKEVNHIVSIDDYEFLQLIKQIQLSNEKSIKQILGETPDVKKDKIDKLIQNFKQGSKPYTNQNGNNGTNRKNNRY